jgi:hypothetical protein
MDFHPVTPQRLAEQGEETLIILSIVEDLLTSIAPGCDVIDRIFKFDP